MFFRKPLPALKKLFVRPARYNKRVLQTEHLPNVLPLAACPQLAGNSRLGFGASTHTLHQGFGFVISSTALGMSAPMYDSRVRSRYTGKERDTESGLDNFGARYFGSSMGRFMSPDSPGFAHLSNPQAWNLYSYAYNNPISSVDPDGHDVASTYNISQCVADANTATGANGQVVANTTVTHHSWLGGLIQFDSSVTKLGISGDEASFRALGQNASRLADLIDNHSFTLEVRYTNDPSNPGGSDTQLPSQGFSPLSIIDPNHSEIGRAHV